ncbi:MAG TPA: DUF305 domain-containing protein [Acidimicrobiales bacterium]
MKQTTDPDIADPDVVDPDIADRDAAEGGAAGHDDASEAAEGAAGDLAGDDAGDGGGGDGEGDEGRSGGGAGLSWGRALALAAALAFLGFAVGVLVSDDDPPGEGSVDVGFYRDMILHHEQALSMASLELAHGENQTVRGYAREVLTFQSFEIGVMRQTLEGWGHAPSSPSDEVMAWMDMPTPADDMPGLASDAEMDELADARGRASDELFLELMARHHRGGLHMAEYAAEHADDEGVRELAARMARNQTQEISEYRITARDLGFDIEI